MGSHVAIGIGVSALVVVYRYVIFPSVVSPLSKIPNAHFTAPVLPLWMWWIQHQGRVNRTTLALHQKLGPVVRIAPNELSVNSAAGLKAIYISGGFEKTGWYADIFSNFDAPNLVSIREHGPHSVLKRMVSNVYSKSYVSSSPDVQRIARVMLFDRLLPVLHAEALSSSSSVDVYRLGKAVGMDFTAAYLFGLADGTDFVRNLADWDQWQSEFDTVKLLGPKGRAFCKTEMRILALCDAAVSSSEKQASSLETQPVVHGQLWRSLQKKYPARSEYNRILAASEMMDHLIAGYETTGVTLAYAMYELSRNPDALSKLRSELLTLSPPIKPSNSDQSLPSFQSIESLPYLEAVVRETLRVYAAAGAPQPRVTPSNKHVVIEGFTVPAGVTVSSSAYTLHRNATVFPDPESWLPDRWIDAERSHLAEMKRWYWPFGSGGRMCIGNHFALLGKFASFS